MNYKISENIKLFLLLSFYLILLSFPIIYFNDITKNNLTFTDLLQNKETSIINFTEAIIRPKIKKSDAITPIYETQEIIAKITIPRMKIYELPIYYSSDDINNNWAITAPGNLGGWGVFGEKRPTAVGAHNYQLFNNLPLLKTGDKITIKTFFDTYVFEVTGKTIFNDGIHDWKKNVFDSANPYSTVLMTCYPIEKIVTNDMYIVFTKMIKGTIFE